MALPINQTSKISNLDEFAKYWMKYWMEVMKWMILATFSTEMANTCKNESQVMLLSKL
jgi:hypothetical protein